MMPVTRFSESAAVASDGAHQCATYFEDFFPSSLRARRRHLMSLALRRLMGTYVGSVPSFDAATLTSAPGVLALIVALPAVFPLRRALRVSAAVALRAE